jgi:hypothetical protein
MTLISRYILIPAFAILGVPAPAFACTLCYSRVASDVRERLFEPDFFTNFLAIASPVPILLVAIALAARDSRKNRN